MLFALLLLVSAPSPQPAGELIAVFVTAPTRDGFIDTTREIQDSIKDVRQYLRGKKDIAVVDSASQADVVLTIVTRGVGSENWGQRTRVYRGYYSGTDITTVPIVANTFWVSAVLKTGTYQRELVGTMTQESAYSLGAWTTCAERIAKDLRAWAGTNAEQLKARRVTR